MKKGRFHVYAIDAKGTLYSLGPESSLKRANDVCEDLRANGVTGSVKAKGLRPFIVESSIREGPSLFHVLPAPNARTIIV